MTTFTQLSTFTSGSPAQASTVAMDGSGDIFGTATGGATSDGYVWVLRKGGGVYESNPVVLATFPSDGSFGANTRAGVVIDSKGNLFGTNEKGYAPFTTANVGTLWELPKTATGYGSLKLLKAFTDFGGQVADALLSVDANDNVYGALQGVVLTGKTASIFKYSAANGYQDVVNYDGFFGNTGGLGATESNIAFDSQNNMYFTGINGGTGAGAVYELPVGASSINTIAIFGQTTSNPHSQISILNNGASSKLFGTGDGDEAGFTNTGDVWELPLNNGVAGTLTTLGYFTGGNGDHPTGGTFLAPDGNLYGTASGSNGGTASIWESVNTGGVFSSPQTVLKFPADASSYPASALVSDGTNLFGTTSSNGLPNAGGIFGVGPATIPGGTPATTKTYLLPVVTNSSIPSVAIGGQVIKGSVNVTVTNTTAGIEKGSAKVGMYAYDGTNFFLLGYQKRAINLKPGKTAAFHIAIKGQLNAGSYSVLPYAFDSASQSTGAATSRSLQVNAPFVALAATSTPVKPASLKLGKAGNFTVTITNHGNIDTTGLANITLGLSLNGVTTAIALPSISHAYKIKAGRTLVLHLRMVIPRTAAIGSYFPVVKYTQDGVTALVVGTVPVVVTA